MSYKKKIGIITYWESNDNYGQQLQCWALQHYLRTRGYDAFLIRQYVWPPITILKRGSKYIKQRIKKVFAAFLYATNLAYKPVVFNRFAFCLDKEACRRQFPIFRKEHLKMSQIFDTPEKLMQNPPYADVYITGSDQVWNYSMPDGPLSNFFLQFGDDSIKRISYAPSIGHLEFPVELKETIKRYLKLFNAISVREASSVSMLSDLGYDATLVLDPTMLLDVEAYLNLAKDSKGKECIFIYSMNYATSDDIPFNEIKQYANNNNLPIIVTPGSGYLPAKELFDEVEYSYATISQWIQHIAHAKLVVTASFHGVVMSILMHRPFLYTPLKGSLSVSNNRVLDLLSILELEDCILGNKIIFKPEIDWQEVEIKLEHYREVSKTFLEKGIES